MRIKADIEIVTGFLGSGKTSFINILLKKTLVAGEKVIVIQDEEGNRDLDRFSDSNYKVIIKECEPTNEITASYIKHVIEFYNPHRVIIECNGMKPLGELLEAIDKLSIDEVCREPIIYSLVEGTTFDMFIGNMRDFILPSISHGNLIIINNCNMLEEEAIDLLIGKLEGINRNAIIIAAQDISHLDSILEKKDILSNGVIKKLRIKLLNGFRRR